ncbi:alpha/beta fold hydrolase [Lyngbya confervoides]|uniref:Alpha/beta hydrolase n=1 Tax=Lyngbya confervoides BDU141951 TaxID=1574623 RepID=A0ABD4T4E7_9CYAN|nr:alpha/beta hydrolase [Lyngbya confervoides]MCM1983215.1 alpha/beta hydrolase [Lyngbya confervoides BDU141951]
MTRLASNIPARLGGTVSLYPWQWQGKSVAIATETLGQGDPVLLLPSLSTVSCRAELTALAQGLAAQFQVTVLDWPGFGDSDRLRLDYGPDLLYRCLQDWVGDRDEPLRAVVAAGHAAGYALSLGESCRKQVLIAPTWRGPLAVMGLPDTVRQGIRTLVRSPLMGSALYGLNTQPGFLKWMYRRHVFTDPERLTPDYIAQRHQGTQAAGARYGPGSFVTGGLDPVASRADFLALLAQNPMPTLIVIGEQVPPGSRAEMEAMATARLPQVSAVTRPGTLGMAEEFGADLVPLVRSFLQMPA